MAAKLLFVKSGLIFDSHNGDFRVLWRIPNSDVLPLPAEHLFIRLFSLRARS